ncbi:hypothetical protein T08_8684 [Trichinella sp. T8]|nr:hypothetical protein T08_15113 [Trichinella sp. T8]KRZ95640.1 hypothetical protein T08_8684 [Trichinella sp. T8]
MVMGTASMKYLLFSKVNTYNAYEIQFSSIQLIVEKDTLVEIEQIRCQNVSRARIGSICFL